MPSLSSQSSEAASAFQPAVLQIPVTVEIPANHLAIFTAIKNNFGCTDAKVVNDCVRFALFCYQQGLVGKADTLLDSLVNQVAAFDTLRERIEQSRAAVREAAFVSSAVVTSLQTELARRPNLAGTKE